MEQDLLLLEFEEEFLDIKKIFFKLLLLIYTLSCFIGIIGVEGKSMENTIEDGDIFFLNKMAYMIHEFKRGEIVIVDGKNIYKNYKGQTLIKRVIGLPGEKIYIRENEIFIDNKKIEETYIKEKMKTNDLYFEIPKDEIFVMGDNRNSSLDSRIFGTIKREDVLGRVITWTKMNKKKIKKG